MSKDATASRADRRPRSGSPRSVALMNQKGGVGKSTTAVNLSAGVAREGRRTLLIDLDPQAHATFHLGQDPADLERSVYDVLVDAEFDPNSALIAVREGLDLLPAEVNLAGAEIELADGDDREHRLRNAITRLDAQYDLIMVDCPPALGLLTLNALAACNEVIIPMQAHFLALQGVGKLLETVQLVGQSLNPALRVSGVVLCMHDSGSNHAKEVVADLESFFEEARGSDLPWRDAVLFEPPIRRNIKLAECPSFGQSIFEYAPDAAGARDYAQLAEAFLRSEPASESAPERAPEPPAPVVVTAASTTEKSATSASNA